MRHDYCVSIPVRLGLALPDLPEFQLAIDHDYRDRIEPGAELSYASTIRKIWGDAGGSQIVEFAVCVPLLTIFAVGIFDFSGALNLKQKMASAAQQGALAAASQPTSDLPDPIVQIGPPPPPSIQAIEKAVFLNLVGQGVLPGAVYNTTNCGVNVIPTQVNLIWTYVVKGCPGTLTITIDRGCVPGGTQAFPNCSGAAPAGEKIIYSHVAISYPYPWQFQNVIQLVGGSSALPPFINVEAYAANRS
jgi:hypothetical protein